MLSDLALLFDSSLSLQSIQQMTILDKPCHDEVTEEEETYVRRILKLQKM